MFLNTIICGFTNCVLGVVLFNIIDKFIPPFEGTLNRCMANYFLKIVAIFIAFFVPIIIFSTVFVK